MLGFLQIDNDKYYLLSNDQEEEGLLSKNGEIDTSKDIGYMFEYFSRDPTTGYKMFNYLKKWESTQQLYYPVLYPVEKRQYCRYGDDKFFTVGSTLLSQKDTLGYYISKGHEEDLRFTINYNGLSPSQDPCYPVKDHLFIPLENNSVYSCLCDADNHGNKNFRVVPDKKIELQSPVKNIVSSYNDEDDGYVFFITQNEDSYLLEWANVEDISQTGFCKLPSSNDIPYLVGGTVSIVIGDTIYPIDTKKLNKVFNKEIMTRYMCWLKGSVSVLGEQILSTPEDNFYFTIVTFDTNQNLVKCIIYNDQDKIVDHKIVALDLNNISTDDLEFNGSISELYIDYNSSSDDEFIHNLITKKCKTGLPEDGYDATKQLLIIEAEHPEDVESNAFVTKKEGTTPPIDGTYTQYTAFDLDGKSYVPKAPSELWPNTEWIDITEKVNGNSNSTIWFRIK